MAIKITNENLLLSDDFNKIQELENRIELLKERYAAIFGQAELDQFMASTPQLNLANILA